MVSEGVELKMVLRAIAEERLKNVRVGIQAVVLLWFYGLQQWDMMIQR